MKFFCYNKKTMSNDRKAALKKLKKLIYQPRQNVDSFRKTIDKTFYSPLLPNGVECSQHNYGGVMCDVLEPGVYSSSKIMLYVHGGSFVGGSRKAYRTFCASLAHAMSCRVVVPEFRLPPTHPFPNSIEDIQLAFRSVFTEEQVACSLDSAGLKNPRMPELMIAADGSGASIALALLLNLRERFRQCISQVVLFSPWLNIADAVSAPKSKKFKDELINTDVITAAADVYTYSSNLVNPLVSPILAEKKSLVGFPPVHIQMGEKEIFLEDAKVFAQRIKDAGGTCTVEAVPDMMYMFQMADDCLRESHLAVERIGRLVTHEPERPDRALLNNQAVPEKSAGDEE